MADSIEENFHKDAKWVLSELKQEELANAYSKHQIKFFVLQRSQDEPNIRGQFRILRMLDDRKAITTSPFFNRAFEMFDDVLRMQGAEPIGYYIQVLQPQFDVVFEELTKQKATPLVNVSVTKLPLAQTPSENKYFIALWKQQVVLNNTFVLSTPNFNGENAQFIEHVVAHPNEVLKRDNTGNDSTRKFKKSFHQILSDLGFRGQIRKLFFDVSKTSVKFCNYISENKLAEMGIDKHALDIELSALERIGRKYDERDGSTMK